MKRTSKCTESMRANLLMLGKKTDLEKLRVPLTKYRLFPRGSNPETYPITSDELKKLIRLWKLHEARGFWKTHQTNEDFVRALLDHMATLTEFNQALEDDTISEANKRKNHTITPRKPSKSKTSRSRPSPRKNFLPPYEPVTSGSGNLTEGMVYLSRVGRGIPFSPTRTQDTIFGRVEDDLDIGLIEEVKAIEEDQLEDDDLSSSFEGNLTSKIRQDARHLFEYSQVYENIPNMIENGAIRAMYELLQTEDRFCALHSLGALANLSLHQVSHAPLVLQSIISILKRLKMIVERNEGTLRLTGGKEATFLMPAYAFILTIYNLSCSDHEDKLLMGNQTINTILSIGNEIQDHGGSLLYLATLSNLIPGLDRTKIGELILTLIASTVHPLIGHSSHYLFLASQSLHNLSYYDSTHFFLFEHNIIDTLKRLVEMADDPNVTSMAAKTLANMSTTSDLHLAFLEDDVIEFIQDTILPLAEEDSEIQLCCSRVLYALIQDPNVISLAYELDIILPLMELHNQNIQKLASLDDSLQIVDEEKSTQLTKKKRSAGMKRFVKNTHILSRFDSMVDVSKEKMSLIHNIQMNVCYSLSEITKYKAFSSCFLEHNVAEALIYYADEDNYKKHPNFYSFLKGSKTIEKKWIKLRTSAFSGLSNVLFEEHTRKPLSYHLAPIVQFESSVPDTIKRLTAMCVYNLVCNPECSDELMAKDVHKSILSMIQRDLIDEELIEKKRKMEQKLEIERRKEEMKESDEHEVKEEETIVQDDQEGILVEESSFIEDSLNQNISYLVKEEEKGPSKEELLSISIDSLFNLMTSSDHCEAMVREGLLFMFETIIFLQHEKVNQTITAALVKSIPFLSILQEGDLKKMANIIFSLVTLSKDPLVLTRCSDVMNALSSFENSMEDIILTLKKLQSASEMKDIVHNCASTLYNMSPFENMARMITNKPFILKKLLVTMRGAPIETQLFSAKALRNFSRFEQCAKLLLEQGVVGDFVVISILRTNSVPIKIVCSETFFSLLQHQETRMKMIEAGVLWASIKLSRIDSDETKLICIKMIFNLSFDQQNIPFLRDLSIFQIISSILSSSFSPLFYYYGIRACHNILFHIQTKRIEKEKLEKKARERVLPKNMTQNLARIPSHGFVARGSRDTSGIRTEPLKKEKFDPFSAKALNKSASFLQASKHNSSKLSTSTNTSSSSLSSSSSSSSSTELSNNKLVTGGKDFNKNEKEEKKIEYKPLTSDEKKSIFSLTSIHPEHNEEEYDYIDSSIFVELIECTFFASQELNTEEALDILSQTGLTTLRSFFSSYLPLTSHTFVLSSFVLFQLLQSASLHERPVFDSSFQPVFTFFTQKWPEVFGNMNSLFQFTTNDSPPFSPILQGKNKNGLKKNENEYERDELNSRSLSSPKRKINDKRYKDYLKEYMTKHKEDKEEEEEEEDRNLIELEENSEEDEFAFGSVFESKLFQDQDDEEEDDEKYDEDGFEEEENDLFGKQVVELFNTSVSTQLKVLTALVGSLCSLSENKESALSMIESVDPMTRYPLVSELCHFCFRYILELDSLERKVNNEACTLLIETIVTLLVNVKETREGIYMILREELLDPLLQPNASLWKLLSEEYQHYFISLLACLSDQENFPSSVRKSDVLLLIQYVLLGGNYGKGMDTSASRKNRNQQAMNNVYNLKKNVLLSCSCILRNIALDFDEFPILASSSIFPQVLGLLTSSMDEKTIEDVTVITCLSINLLDVDVEASLDDSVLSILDLSNTMSPMKSQPSSPQQSASCFSRENSSILAMYPPAITVEDICDILLEIYNYSKDKLIRDCCCWGISKVSVPPSLAYSPLGASLVAMGAVQRDSDTKHLIDERVHSKRNYLTFVKETLNKEEQENEHEDQSDSKKEASSKTYLPTVFSFKPKQSLYSLYKWKISWLNSSESLKTTSLPSTESKESLARNIQLHEPDWLKIDVILNLDTSSRRSSYSRRKSSFDMDSLNNEGPLVETTPFFVNSIESLQQPPHFPYAKMLFIFPPITSFSSEIIWKPPNDLNPELDYEE